MMHTAPRNGRSHAVALRSILALLALVSAAHAVDVPVHGRALSLRAEATGTAKRLARFSLADDAIRPPFEDPREGSRLLVSGGARPGQCRVEVALDPAKWQPLIEGGRSVGYRYVDPVGSVAGVRRVVVRRGRIAMLAGLDAWPCALAAASEREPVSVELELGRTRYCSDFGGRVLRNEKGRFLALSAVAPAACGKRDVTAASLNVLHGVNCPFETRFCRLNDRSILLFDWVEAIGCPDVLAFQEIFRNWSMLIAGYQESVCPFVYQRAYFPTGLGIDDQIILSRFPIVEREVTLLYRDFRSVTFARIDHPTGPLDVFSTHLASSSDGGGEACGDDCPLACDAAGAITVRDCQAVQLAQYVEERHTVPGPALIAGDFNAPPGSFVYRQFVDRGWTDAYLEGGNPECDPSTGTGCTSGRDDVSLNQLQVRESNETERIDYIFLVPSSAGADCDAKVEAAGDPDGDSTSTALFADIANPFSPTCGAMPEPICHPSDHVGVQVDVGCAE